MRLLYDRFKPYYCEVEYLKASSQQYIDTGIMGKSGVRVEIGFEWGSEDIGNDKYVLAAAHPSYGRVYFGTYQSKWMYGYGTYYQAGTPVANTYYKGEVSWEKGNQYMKVNDESLYTGTSTTSVGTGYTLYMFARNQETPGWYSSAKIYYCKMWEDGVLVRDYIPVLDWDMKPAMYDKVSGKLFYNLRAGVPDFTYGREIHYVDYLEADGTQYINTGLLSTALSKVDVEFSLTDTTKNSNNNAAIFGGRINTTSQTFTYFFLASTTPQYFRFDFSGQEQIGNDSQLTINNTSRYRFSYNGVTMKTENLTTKESVSLNKGPSDLFTTYPIALFGVNTQGTVGTFLKGKVYHYWYTDGTSSVDMYPAIDENGVGFMFDKVSHTCFLNAGSGIFKYPPVETEYIEVTDLGTNNQNPCIDLGLKYKPSMSIESKYTRTGMGVSGSILPLSNSTTQPLIYMPALNGSAKTDRFVWRRSGLPEASYYYDFADYPMTVEFKVDAVNDALTVNGNVVKTGMIAAMNGYTDPYESYSNLYMLSINGTYGGMGKVYYLKIYDSKQVYRDLIPVWKDGVACMYDKQNNVYYSNTKTGTVVCGKIVHKNKVRLMIDGGRRVPKGFKEVEYIQSSGTQYINTGFIPTGNTGIDMRFLITGRGSGGNDSNIIMSGGDSANYRCGFGYRSSSDNTYGHTLQVSGICATGASWENYAMATNVPHTVLYNYDNQKKCYLDGVLKRENIPYGTATVTYPMFIFSSNMNGASWRTSSFKLYYCKIVDNGILVRDFIPCLDSNNVPCLWDTVTKQAYYNQGTGDFTYGSQIIPVKYLESTGTQYIDTLWSPKSNDLRVAFKVKSVSSPHTTAICGAEKTNTIPRWVFIMYGQNADTTKTFPLTGNWNNTTNGFTFTSGIVLDIDWTTSKSSTTITDKVSNTTYTYSFGTDITYSNNDVTLKLFCNALTQKSAIQMSCYKIWDNNELVRDYIAVKDENNVGYMLDRVSHTLYNNNGTGSFIVGDELKEVTRFLKG